MEQVEKAGRSARVVLVNVVVASTISVALLPWHPAQSQEKDPRERTARSIMTELVRKLYGNAIEACYQEAGRVARGPAFLDCLKRQVRSEETALDSVYKARISYLGSFPELAATLQNAQRPGYTFATRTARTYEPSNEQMQMNLFRIVY